MTLEQKDQAFRMRRKGSGFEEIGKEIEMNPGILKHYFKEDKEFMSDYKAYALMHIRG